LVWFGLLEGRGMSNKTHSESDSSPEENKLYISPSFVRDREEKGWRSYATSSELMTTASAIFSQINNPSPDDDNQVNFLYDYYGMTDETRQEPPSPGHSPVTGTSKEIAEHHGEESSSSSREHEYEEHHAYHHHHHHINVSDNVDIPLTSKDNVSPELEPRHSFAEKPTLSIFSSQASESSANNQRKSYSSIPPLNKNEKSSSSHANTSSPVIETESAPKSSFNHYSRPMLYYEDNNQLSFRYMYVLEAQTSLVQKRGEDSLTYLNKGQFYFISFEAQHSKAVRVKSIIHLVFRNEKEPDNELTHWRYWYNQQPNPNQRALDIDMKSCQNIEDVEEVGYNALAVYWDPNAKSKVSLRINCLSTDFSAQKGVKGIPLHLQIDTFEDFSDATIPTHRAFCQIKVFRDKGAERKNKDEAKTVNKRVVKYLKGSDNAQADMLHVFQMQNKVTFLYPTTNILSKSVVFVPPKEREKERTRSTDGATSINTGGFFSQLRERENKRGFNAALSNTKDDLEQLDVLPRSKKANFCMKKSPAVTIYVRKEEEKAYNALMLEVATLDSLKNAISVKYNVPEEMIKQVFKKTKKGILVFVDDQLVEQFVDEDDFLISIDFDNQMGHFEVVFNC